ncbi:hypothetical protein TPA4_70 [Tsukamurella phage TPA4]|uniref:hypothetical protein n=1 Tax=Tsukamurella phage TPA4 TaxID=1647476 RepID=UPI0007B619E8|nr:hypothetical protein BH784_gp70 [Tsukamurella phage TPA4]AKJ72235.1 hypothetical protein TPA4_70 [Tsukamurella phage TPA4]
MNLPARSDGQPRLFTPDELVALGRCVLCEHHAPTQGHHHTCPAFPVWHLASGKPPRPYIPTETRELGSTPMPDYDTEPTDPAVLDLDVQIQGDSQP